MTTNEDKELSPEQILRKVNKVLEKIEEAKSDRSKAIGRRDETIAQMKRSHKIGSVDAAEKRIKALDEQITRRNRVIVKAFEKLDEEYELSL